MLPYCRWLLAGLVSSVPALKHSGTATVKRQTGLVSGDLRDRILLTGNKAQRGVVSLSFTMSRLRSVWSLPPLRLPVISTAVAVCVCLPPVKHVHAAWGLAAAVLSYRYASKAQTKTKRNSYTCTMRAPTSDHHFKVKIMRIILQILR